MLLFFIHLAPVGLFGNRNINFSLHLNWKKLHDLLIKNYPLVSPTYHFFLQSIRYFGHDFYRNFKMFFQVRCTAVNVRVKPICHVIIALMFGILIIPFLLAQMHMQWSQSIFKGTDFWINKYITFIFLLINILLL